MDIMYGLIFLAGLLFAWLLFQRFAEADLGKGEKDHTGIQPTLKMYQLNPATMEGDKCFLLNDFIMEGDGYTISGCKAKKGTLRLSGKYQEAGFVSQEHATVFKDTDECYYIQDNDSRNGMKKPGYAKREKLIKIENGSIVYLGSQPVQFFFVNNIGKDKPEKVEVEGTKPPVRKKPVRRNLPVDNRR